VLRAQVSVRSIAVCAALVATTSMLTGCSGQGQQLTPPPTAPVASPAASPVTSPVVIPASSPQPAPPESAPGQTHTVTEGDTLASIAQKYYEDGGLWRKIYEANREAIGDNPDSIKIGQSLRIPPRE
jgi:nucleoid-associated protein YgaU